MQKNHSSSSRARRITGNIFVYAGTFVLVASALAKFAHVPKVVSELGAFGFDGGRLTLIAVLELLSAILFAVPRTRAAGVLLVSAYMGGAVATHIQHGQSPVQPAIILAILWMGAWLRNPETMWSMKSQDRDTSTKTLRSVA